MWETYGPMQGNPPTYNYDDFWQMVKSNKRFAEMFTGEVIKAED
jgi:hypothetical protein